MKSIVLLLFAYCAVYNLFNCVNATNTAEPKQLQVEVFYEALCPDSMRFIQNQLYKAMKSNSWLPYTDLDFIPYGNVNAKTDPFTNITHLDCQHGQRECDLNALHACIVEHNTIEEQLEMINCLMKDSFTDVDACSKELKIDVSAAKNCKTTRTNSEILKKYGDKTTAIDISFVPSIGLGGVFNRREQEEILTNFSKVFCTKYKEKFCVNLEKC